MNVKTILEKNSSRFFPCESPAVILFARFHTSFFFVFDYLYQTA